jgi:hypothetical protein
VAESGAAKTEPAAIKTKTGAKLTTMNFDKKHLSKMPVRQAPIA